MEEQAKRYGLGVRITVTVLVVQIIVFTALFLLINNSVSSSSYQNAVNNMQTAAQDRSEIIGNYIQSTEDTLTAYLKAQQIYDLLRDLDNAEKTAAAQKYTENFGKDISNLEGIYASSWDTMMRVHTTPQVVGKITRPDEAKRKQLHDAILATDGVYNTGIIISPATGEQIISMYKAVREEDGSPIGLGGIGIFTSGLVENIVDDITESCKRQKEMAEQINSDINKISGVVQSNSATAEESAAASEELSGQAGMLKELVGKFKL